MLSSVMQSTCPFCLSGEVVARCGCRYAETARRHTIVVARGWFLADGGQYPKRETPLATPPPSPAVEAPVTRDAPVKVVRPPKPKLAKLEALVETTTRKAGSFAPPGSCQWCDDRRKRDAARVARHRAKTARNGGTGGGTEPTAS